MPACLPDGLRPCLPFSVCIFGASVCVSPTPCYQGDLSENKAKKVHPELRKFQLEKQAR